MKILLESKFINLDTQNKLGDTALIAASYKGHPEVVKHLVIAKADMNLRNGAGDCAKKAASNPKGNYIQVIVDKNDFAHVQCIFYILRQKIQFLNLLINGEKTYSEGAKRGITKVGQSFFVCCFHLWPPQSMILTGFRILSKN